MKQTPVITKSRVETLLETRFLNVYDLQYAEGRHYYDASRKKLGELTALLPDEEFRRMLPDAVTLNVILRTQDEDRLLLFYEYRYPAGHFLLSPPAGLIEKEEKEQEDAIFRTAVRELFEETGIRFSDRDEYRLLNPGLFSSPGMTDESNAVALFVIHDPDLSVLSDQHTEETEVFDGFCLLNREEAMECLRRGRDERGNLYSIYTWQALLVFVSGIWKQ